MQLYYAYLWSTIFDAIIVKLTLDTTIIEFAIDIVELSSLYYNHTHYYSLLANILIIPTFFEGTLQNLNFFSY